MGITPTQEEFVRKVAEKVKRNGRAFEVLLGERERENPSFGFLWNEKVGRLFFVIGEVVTERAWAHHRILGMCCTDI